MVVGNKDLSALSQLVTLQVEQRHGTKAGAVLPRSLVPAPLNQAKRSLFSSKDKLGSLSMSEWSCLSPTKKLIKDTLCKQTFCFVFERELFNALSTTVRK